MKHPAAWFSESPGALICRAIDFPAGKKTASNGSRIFGTHRIRKTHIRFIEWLF